MKNCFDIVKIALLLSAIFLFSTYAKCQKNVLELLPGSEKMGYNQKLGYHYLVGGVKNPFPSLLADRDGAKPNIFCKFYKKANKNLNLNHYFL